MKAPLFWSAVVGEIVVNCGTGLIPAMTIVPLFWQRTALCVRRRTRLLLLSVKITSPFWPLTIETVSGNWLIVPLPTISSDGEIRICADEDGPPSPLNPGVPPAITVAAPAAVTCTIW